MSGPSPSLTVVDTVRTIETPEGVELQLRPAGPVARLWAFAADQALVWIALMVVGIGLAFLGPLGLGLWLILAFFAQWLYPVFFEVLGGGRTLGKRWVGLRVLMADGRPVGWSPSLIRNLLRVVDGLPGAYTVGLISLLLTRDFQRIGDLVAGTLVVHVEASIQAPRLPMAEPMAPSHPLTLEEQSALISFAERSTRLTPARSEELANVLVPLSGARGAKGLAHLLGMARYLWGGS
ncbi:RDD family protein [Geothrix sp. PMB-07]|uniref:RDD family protein n=1 Tax=Geothrix sp. PMB-07 TaxID=3068640 RepID=UPI002740BABA|nr:RDD family protein [Geothrix sp. PMB-07]WLT31946.1 RDD family protein [Geothrix sp. PMB-07]